MDAPEQENLPEVSGRALGAQPRVSAEAPAHPLARQPKPLLDEMLCQHCTERRP